MRKAGYSERETGVHGRVVWRTRCHQLQASSGVRGLSHASYPATLLSLSPHYEENHAWAGPRRPYNGRGSHRGGRTTAGCRRSLAGQRSGDATATALEVLQQASWTYRTAERRPRPADLPARALDADDHQPGHRVARQEPRQVPQHAGPAVLLGHDDRRARACRPVRVHRGRAWQARATAAWRPGADYKGKFYRIHHNPETAAKAYAPARRP